MRGSKERILKELSTAIDSVCEALFQLSETDDMQLEYKPYERVDSNLNEAFELLDNAKNIIGQNMKGE